MKTIILALLSAFVLASCGTTSQTVIKPSAQSVGCSSKAVQSFHCFAKGVSPQASISYSTGYTPSDLRDAYKLTTAATTLGTGNTIAIVDAWDDPNAESDLKAYRTQFNLPACTTANGCFRKVNVLGQQSHYPITDIAAGQFGWSFEISIDLDMASAICPNCKILLVEASSASWVAMGQAQNEAAFLGANEISDSWGDVEDSRVVGLNTKYFNHPGIAQIAGSGDGGYLAPFTGSDSTPSYPASSPNFTSVGGTTLSSADNGRGWSETVWNDGEGDASTSGCSTLEPKPSWQAGTATDCSTRMSVDVAAVADGVAIRDTFGTSSANCCWWIASGTSVSTPIIAGVYALAGNARTLRLNGSSYIYSHSGNLFDVTSGDNKTTNHPNCTTEYFCTAGIGYDGPTGLGTPNGIGAF